MHKLLSLVLATVMVVCLACSHAEQSGFPAGDWTLLYALGDSAIAEQRVLIRENNTFEVSDEDESKEGTWTFDGETLVLTADGADLSLKWNEDARQFSGEYSGMALTLFVTVEPEAGSAVPDETMGIPELAGGWTVAEDSTVTDEISSLLWQGLDSYQTGIITVSYSPVAYLGWQIVAGTNHAILCRSQEINQPAVWAVVYLYADPEGNVTVLNIAELPLGV